MLNLTESAIIKAGGKLNKERPKKKKKENKSFCKTYETPPDVIKYYNNPNYCLHCRKKIGVNNHLDYYNMKQQIFCSSKCTATFMQKVHGTQPTENYLRYCATKLVNATIDGDCILIDWLMKEFQNEVQEFIIWQQDHEDI